MWMWAQQKVWHPDFQSHAVPLPLGNRHWGIKVDCVPIPSLTASQAPAHSAGCGSHDEQSGGVLYPRKPAHSQLLLVHDTIAWPKASQLAALPHPQHSCLSKITPRTWKWFKVLPLPPEKLCHGHTHWWESQQKKMHKDTLLSSLKTIANTAYVTDTLAPIHRKKIFFIENKTKPP
jgi:hypothetical protein